MGWAIPWEDMIRDYDPRNRLAVVLIAFLGFYLMLDRGKHGLECGWGWMLQCMLE